MSEPKLISPMLDGFEMGSPISEHNGVRCCPAMRKDSDDKYIVKIISVPASQTKLDALLLTGAYPDKTSALTYFHEVANGIIDEKKILDNLAKLEGFVSFEDCQVVPMEDGSGFDVYLLSDYRMTLERQNSHFNMTQLSAVNLGLDLCAALAVSRRSGYMCVDLKPSNIYITGENEYKIGDLGFVRLNSLKYESLPDMYRSCYTAPEVENAFAPLNDTIDVYALGLILYQIYNGGELPFSGNVAPSEKLNAPAYADEEIAEIILKACDPDPAQRWSDPVQMGQAIVSYMQKNGVNDTPIIPEIPQFADVEKSENEEMDVQSVITEVTEEAEIMDAHVEDAEDSSLIADVIAAADAAFPENEHSDSDSEFDLSDISDGDGEESDDESELTWDKLIEEATAAAGEGVSAAKAEDEFQEEEYDNLSFLDDFDEDTAKVLADLENQETDGESEEFSDFLDQIDALTEHQVPDPVVAPDPIEIKIPEPLPIDEPVIEHDDSDDLAEEVASYVEAATAVSTTEAEEDIPDEELPYIPKKKRTGLIWGIILALLLFLGVGGYFFYTLYYLQPIHALSVSGSEDKLNVQVTADIDETLLSITCSDSHGKKVSAPVVGGKAVFSGLTPDTAYTVTVEVDGFHKLTGATSKVYSTPLQTKITQMHAITGSESGSVILSFTVEGPDSEQWNVIYNADGEAERVTAFPSHMVTLTGLTVDKEYTFRLEPIDDIYLSGETELTYTAKNLVCAENLHITACSDGQLTAQWNTPQGVEVTEWTVRCYNADGYDQTIVTAENTATFQDIDDTAEHTVEVTAADMSVNQRVIVGANSVTISNFSVAATTPGMLALSWNSNREIPAEGWTIRYSVNGINASAPIITKENTAGIPAIPGVNYVFTILDGFGNPVLGGPFTYNSAATVNFDGYGITMADITARLCKTPAASSWSYKDLKDEDYVNAFSAGEKVSMVLALAKNTETSDDSVCISFAVYDENNNLVSFSHNNQTWQSMWYQNYCELDISGIPTEIGTYNVAIYFNGALAGSQKFEITT